MRWEKIEQRKTDFLDFGLTRLDTHDLLSAKVIEGKIYRKRFPKKSRARVKSSRSGSIITVEDESSGTSHLLSIQDFNLN